MMHILCLLPTYVCGVILLTNHVFLPVGRVSGISRSHRVLRVKIFVYTSWGLWYSVFMNTALALSNCIHEYIRNSHMLLTLMPG